MQKLTIIVDIDNTINNLVEQTIEIYNSEYGKDLKIEDFVEYDPFKILPYEDALLFVELRNHEDFWMTLSPYKNAQWGIRKLINDGHDVYLATSVWPYNFPWLYESLQHYFGIVPANNVIRIQNRGLLNCDILIDDNLDGLLSHKTAFRICMDQPWNQSSWDDVHMINRCHNWEEIIEVVDKIYN